PIQCCPAAGRSTNCALNGRPAAGRRHDDFPMPRFGEPGFNFFAVTAMKHLLVILVVAITNALVLGQEKSGQPALAQNGVLNKAQAQFEQIFQFAFDGAKIKLDRSGWGDAPKTPPAKAPARAVAVMANAPPIEQIFNDIRANAGQVTSSGGSY